MTSPLLPWLTDQPIDDPELDQLQFTETARELVELLNQPAEAERSGHRAFVATVEGRWGMGKSSLINLIVGELRERCQVEPLLVRFDAALSAPDRGSPWEALAPRIGRAVFERLRAQARETQRRAAAGPDRGWLWLHIPDQPAPLKLPASTFLDPSASWLELALVLFIEGCSLGAWHPCLELFLDRGEELPGRQRAASPPGRLAMPWEHRRVGDRVAVSCEEFADRLRELLTVLERVNTPPLAGDAPICPPDPTWSLVIQIENVGRLGEPQQRRLLDALSYLRRVDRTLVLLDWTRAPWRRAPTERRSERWEDDLLKRIDLHLPVPVLRAENRQQMVQRWLVEGGLAEDRSARARHLSMKLVVLFEDLQLDSLRELKRALSWLHRCVIRWRRFDEGRARHTLASWLTARDTAAEDDLWRDRLVELLRFLVQVHVWERTRERPPELPTPEHQVFTHLPRLLWTGHWWPDDLEDAPLGPADWCAHDELRAMVEQVRRARVIEELGLSRDLAAPQGAAQEILSRLERQEELLRERALTRADHPLGWVPTFLRSHPGPWRAEDVYVYLRGREDLDLFGSVQNLISELRTVQRELRYMPRESVASPPQEDTPDTILTRWMDRSALDATWARLERQARSEACADMLKLTILLREVMFSPS